MQRKGASRPMQIEINVITSAIVMVMMLACVRGYWHLISVERGTWGFYMVRAVVLGSVTAILRTGYWDMLPFGLGEYWPYVRATMGGQTVSALFNAPLILAAYYVLCSRLMIIPENDRHNWRWWNAWMHPNGVCLRIRLRSKD